MKLTQRQIIVRTLKAFPQKWFKSYELIKVQTPYGWLGTGAGREARRLAEEEIIEVRHIEKYAEYKHKEPLQKYEKVFKDGEWVMRQVNYQPSMPLNTL